MFRWLSVSVGLNDVKTEIVQVDTPSLSLFDIHNGQDSLEYM
jgi:hypothetical protein